MKKSLILSTLLFASSLLASDLKVGFADAKWDGITVPKDEVCSDCWDAKNLASARIHTWPPDA